MGRVVIAAATLSVSAAWGGPPIGGPDPARAATAVVDEHRAAVIIDTGTEVKSVCVRFREESITGVEALARARVDPVLQTFSGKGAAVCALCGVGCPAGASCLTCNAEGRFWSYSRAPAGTGTLRTSGLGASSTAVRDGDVEGWRWAIGGTPPFTTVEQVCGEAAAPVSTTAATSASATVATSAPGLPAATPVDGPVDGPDASTTSQAGRRTTTTVGAPRVTPPPLAPTTTPSAAASSTGTAPGLTPTSSTTPAAGLAASPASSRSGQGSGDGSGLALFGVVLAGLVAWAALTRRARRGTR